MTQEKRIVNGFDERLERAVRRALTKEEMHHLDNFAHRAPCNMCHVLLSNVRITFNEDIGFS